MTAFLLHANDRNRASVLANAHRFLDMLPAGKSFRVEIEPHSKARSSRQCRYLNGVAYRIIGDALGFERDDVSEYLCGQYFGWKEKPLPGGRTQQVPNRTTTTGHDGKRAVLSVAEFADYVAFCQRFAAEHGIYVPDPEQEYLEQAA